MSSTLEVYILTYNRADYLRESIGSVLASSFKDFTLTVVDNCSTDNTKEVVEGFDDSRLSYVRHPENIGGINNINSAIRMATADYIVLFHDDDKMKPDMLKEEYEFLERHPEAGCVSCLTSNFFEDGHVEDDRPAFEGEYNIYSGRELFDAYFAGTSHTVCPSIMYRKKVLDAHDLFFDPAVGPCCDIKLLFDIERYGDGVGSLGKCLMQTRRHSGQDSTMNYFPMHIELYSYLHNDSYYGPMLSEKKQWGLEKYKDFSRALASLVVRGKGSREKHIADEKLLREAVGSRLNDRCVYSVTVFAAKLFPGLMKSIYRRRKGGDEV
ncbi:MAG: glycosyltransferase family 2 protein [Clostridiales bacterium]|nr:glycosyltransferase family 2 protein [Clostridiales bacterium]